MNTSTSVSYEKIPLENIYTFISDSVLSWKGQDRVRKTTEQKEVLFHDATGALADEFFTAVTDINAVFGYEKLLAQLSTKSTVNDGEFLVYVDKYREARSFLRDVARSRASFDDQWSGYVWSSDSKVVNRGVVVIAVDRTREIKFGYHLRKSLFFLLGYPGHSSIFPESIFGAADTQAKRDAVEMGLKIPWISETDQVILRFCDRNLSAGMTKTDLKQVLRSSWKSHAITIDKKQGLSVKPPQTAR